MKKALQSILFALLTLTVAGALCVALAEPATVSVLFRGVTDMEDGTSSVTELEGSFRILADGIEVGTVASGEGILALDRTDHIRVEPMAETMPVGWQIPATISGLSLQPGQHNVVSVTVHASSDPAVTTPAPLPDVTPEPAPAPEMQDEDLPDAGVTDPQNSDPDAMTWDETEEPSPASASATQATPVPTLPPYSSVMTSAPTPEPVLSALTGGEGTGTLLVSVFLDSNRNGEWGKWEKAAKDFPVYILKEDGTPVAKAVSDSSGIASFSGLEPGNYVIRMSFEDDWGISIKGNDSCIEFTQNATADSEPVPVKADQTVERAVGVMKYIHVGGYCWLETEADGIKKDGEQMLPGVRITLEGQKNGLFYETESDENGNWSVYRVKPGFYTVTAYAPDGMMFTRYSREGGKARSFLHREGVSQCSETLDLNDQQGVKSQSRDDVNIGFTWAGKIAGRCFLDANYNGLYDEGELPMTGVKVTAIKPNDDEIAKTFSGEDGTFTLTGLFGNNYTIRAVLPDDGSDFTKVVSDPLGNHFQAREGRRENFWKDFRLNDGETREMNVGVIYPSAISGTVYLDNDFSGNMSGKESAVKAGQPVTLKDSEGNTLGMRKTNAKGQYEFTDLTPGNYTLEMDALEGYAFTKPGDGNIMLNLTGGKGYTEPFFVPLGEKMTGLDIGMIRPATVQGSVFADRNDNGVPDNGENGLSGTVVRLMSDEGEQFRAEIETGGDFLFDAVMPGEYWLEYELPEFGIFAKLSGKNGNTISGDGRTGAGEHFTVKSGDTVDAPLCGGLTLGRITGTVFNDHDGNGEAIDEEEPLPGTVLTLQPSREDLEPVECTTGEDGTFALTELHPDTYTLSVKLPEGYVSARTHLLKLPLSHGVNDQTVSLTVNMGDSWTDQMLGAAIPSGLKGQVWLDENCNGLFDEGEQTPEGYQVTVTDEMTGSVFSALTTDTEGRFETWGMVPGLFTVSYEMDDRTEPSGEGDSTFTQEGRTLVMRGIRLEGGTSREDLRLGMIRYTTLAGSVWIDRGNGIEQLAEARVTLKDESDQELQSVTTGSDGAYSFTGLLPGEYRIAAELPSGCVVVEPEDDRLEDGLVSVMTETNSRRGESDLITVIMGADRLRLNIGSVLPGRIGDLCWLDLNGNGLQDTDEPGISGVKIELLRDGEPVAETESGDYGFWRFTDVYPAAYTLRVTPPAEVRATVHREDIPVLCSVLLEDGDEVFESVPVTVQSDCVNYNADLGFVCRKDGVLPDRLNEGPKMDWRKPE